jgi:nucleotide sugar dehydrogenase
VDQEFPLDVVIVGGCGHVGLPLAIALADSGAQVAVYDVSEQAVALVGAGTLPFDEPGAAPVLQRVVSSGALRATTDPAVVAEAENVVVVIGTPVDEHLNPDPRAIPRALEACAPYFRDGQLLVLRSTVYPGVTAQVERMLEGTGRRMDIAFCPERIAEGKAMTELYSLPQLVGARDDRSRERASRLFRRLTDQIVDLSPEEAELAKLFTNTWRYIRFAAANQFWMMANDRGLDFERIRPAPDADYPRAADMPGAGFAAGPCLFKDTCSWRLQQQQLRARHSRCWSTRGCRSTWWPARGAARPALDDGRHPGHGLQGRQRRHPLEPELQAAPDPRVQGRPGPVHRPLRAHRRLAGAAGRRARRRRPAHRRDAARRVRRA